MEEKNQFKNGIPGKKFVHLFYKRWKSELSKRKPQILTVARAAACNISTVDNWFGILEIGWQNLMLLVDWNKFSMPMKVDPTSGKVLCKHRSVKIIVGSGKEC